MLSKLGLIAAIFAAALSLVATTSAATSGYQLTVTPNTQTVTGSQLATVQLDAHNGTSTAAACSINSEANNDVVWSGSIAAGGDYSQAYSFSPTGLPKNGKAAFDLICNSRTVTTVVHIFVR